ncbi:MAG: DUF4143 domain-containing protein [Candidatus Wallbacteria bacterium]|nr:DUF4143 domain-containing protein [Candidatus Wallbacteria bacterium]
MLNYGSFPEVYKTSSKLKRELLKSYYDTILFKDCIADAGIRESRLLRELAFYCVSNAPCLFSYNGLGKAMNSNENTVSDFLGTMEKAFLFSELKKFSFSITTQSKGKRKLYCSDNGFCGALSFRFTENRGRLFENLVFTELEKNGMGEVFFFHQNHECDFIVKQGRSYTAIQVTIKLTPENREREIRGINAAIKKLNANTGYIITIDQEETISSQVRAVPFYKFFSGFDDYLSVTS